MNTKYLFRTLRVLICLGIISIVFYYYIPPEEDRVESMNTTVGIDRVDVLCVGSSHMFVGLNPVQMYKDHGYAAYMLAIGAQSPWQSYYYLQHACGFQHPKLVIIDTYMMGLNQEDGDYQDSQTVENMLDTPISVEKIKTVFISEAERKLDIILRFPYVYDVYDKFTGFTRYKLIGFGDYSMGYTYNDRIVSYIGDWGIDTTNEIKPISPKNEKYLRKVIDYCSREGIDLILINAPTMNLEDGNQGYYNYIGKIASENGVPFIDGNSHQDEIQIDWNKDTCDGGDHLNHAGVTKFTNYVLDFIENHYDIPDRRNDTSYSEYGNGIRWLKECTNNT